MQAVLDPLLVSVVSPSDFWLLGLTHCSAPTGQCAAFERTTDGGRTFVPLPAPPAKIGMAGAEAGITGLRFVTAEDGHAFGTSSTGPLWLTDDGGEQWQAAPFGDVLGFAATSSRAYAVTATCRAADCGRPMPWDAPVGTDRWASAPLPLAAIEPTVSVTASGGTAWIAATRPSLVSGPVLLRSTSGGRQLRRVTDPCTLPTLAGCDVAAASPNVVWAFGGPAPYGTGAVYRSTDAGTSRTRSDVGNGADAGLGAPVDTATAVVAVRSGALFRTTDDGRRWREVAPPTDGRASWSQMAFATTGFGHALEVPRFQQSTGTIQPLEPSQQLRFTVDGGRHWTSPAAVSTS